MKNKPEEKQTTVASSIKKVQVTIHGKPPGLLMSSKGGMEESGGKKSKLPTAEDQARNAAYWCEDGTLGIPWENLYKSIVAAAKRFRFKGRETMAAIVSATIACEEVMISLGTSEYRHDARWGRIPPKTGGVVMLNRAHLASWEASFVLLVDDEFYPADSLKAVLETAGKLIGICANRPQLQGPNGRFDVIKWELE